MRVNFARSLMIAVLGISNLAGVAQVISFDALISQKSWPEAMKLVEIPPDYRAVEIKSGSGGGSPFDMFGSFGSMMMMGALGGGAGGQNEQQAEGMRFVALMEVSWTRGETVKAFAVDSKAREPGTDPKPAAITFLVTYKPAVSFADMSAAGATPPNLANVPFRLVLVSLDSITSITPRPDVTRESYGPQVTSGSPTPSPSDKAQTLSNVKQLAMGLLMYQADYDDVLPWAQSTKTVKAVTHPYMKNIELWRTKNPNGGEFRFNMSLGGVSGSNIEDPAGTPMLFESIAWPDGSRVIAFADGHAKALSSEEWNRLQPKLRLSIRRTAKKPLPADYFPGLDRAGAIAAVGRARSALRAARGSGG